MIDEIEPRCPNCDYDLRGLPIPHHCPECGTYVDVVQTVWRASLGAMLFSDMTTRIAFGLLGVSVVAASLAFRGGSGPAGITLIIVLTVLILVGWLLRHVYRQMQLSMGPEGLTIRRPYSVRSIAWDRISHFQRMAGNAELWQIVLKDPSESVVLPAILVDEIAVREFHRSLGLAKARWGPRLLSPAEERLSGIRANPQNWGDLTGVLRDPRYSGMCPWCTFELTGHPARSICPGCGKPYSPQLRVWRPAHWMVLTGAITATMLLVAAAVLMAFELHDNRPPPGVCLVVAALAFAAILTMTIWLGSKYTANGLVVIDENGLETRRFGEIRKICWDQIQDVRREKKNVIIVTEDGPRRIDRFFATAGDAEDFVRYAEKLIKAQGETAR